VTRLTFPSTRRLRSPLDFQRVYDQRVRAGDEHLLVFAAANTGLTRIGLSVSRKHGPSVVRHRIRRLLREAYRLEQRSIPEGLDLILIPRVGPTAQLQDYRNSLVRLVRRLTKKLAQRPTGANQRTDGGAP